jgi:thymidylate synthase
VKTYTSQEKNEDTQKKYTSNWSEAAEKAQHELNQLNRRIRQLRQAISTFKRNEKDGVPWPSPSAESATHN